MKNAHSVLKSEIQLFRWYIFISCVAILVSIIPVFEGYNMNFNKNEISTMSLDSDNGRDHILMGTPILYSLYKARVEKTISPVYFVKNSKDVNIVIEDK